MLYIPHEFSRPCATIPRLGCAEDAETWPWIFGAAGTKCPTFLRVEMDSAGRNSKQHLKSLVLKKTYGLCAREVSVTSNQFVHSWKPPPLVLRTLDSLRTQLSD